MLPGDRPPLQLEVDGHQVEVPDRGVSLLEVLREDLGLRSAKDGCSPQGQCGCCTVLVDGQPRVACVTPARRVAGRTVTTVDGLAEGTRERWADAFCDAGASQCGFCTPGHHLPPRGLAPQGPERRPPSGRAGVAGPPVPLHRLAHDPRWLGPGHRGGARPDGPGHERRRGRASEPRRRRCPGRRPGAWRWAGRASPTTGAPADALVAVPDGAGGWAIGRIAGRGPPGGPQGAGTTHDRRRPASARGARRRLERRRAHVVGRAGLPRARRVVVRAGGRPGVAAGQRRGVRLEDGEPGRRRRPAARRRARSPGTGAPRPRGRRAPRAQATAGGRRRPARRHRPPPRRAHRGIAAAIALVAPGLTVEEVDVVGPPTSVSASGGLG